MGLFVPERLDRVKFGEYGPVGSKVEHSCEIASDDNACYGLSGVWKTFTL
jgi:hypothetical protein